MEVPWRMVNFERVTWAALLEIVTTVWLPPPSIMVVRATEPKIATLMPMFRFSR